MVVVNINLIQQQQRRALRLNQANIVVAVVAGTILGLELLVAAFLYTTGAVRAGQRDAIIRERQGFEQQLTELNKHNNVLYPGMALGDQARAYEKQVEISKALMDNHKYFTLYLSEIAINTPAQITYSTFSSDANDRLVVTGTADSYAEVSKLAESFGKLSFAKKVDIQEAKLDPARVGAGQSVTFTMAIELKSAAELKRLPSRPSGSLNFDNAASPAPSPLPSPSPTAGLR